MNTVEQPNEKLAAEIRKRLKEKASKTSDNVRFIREAMLSLVDKNMYYKFFPVTDVKLNKIEQLVLREDDGFTIINQIIDDKFTGLKISVLSTEQFNGHSAPKELQLI